MRIHSAALLLLALPGSCMMPGPVNPPVATASSLAEALGTRTAQPPVACINLPEMRGSTLFPDENAVVFETRGNTLYLNRFRAQCDNIRAGLALRTNTPAGRLCAGDIVQIFDPVGDFSHGACSLAEFIPYTDGG